MKLLEQVKSGKEHLPRRIMLYGTQGIGKSTWASMSEKPIFIQTEDGLGEIDCDKFPLAEKFSDVITALAELYSDDHPYKTLVLDSLDWLERMIWEEVCKKNNVSNIQKIGYQEGYVFALNWWRDFLEGLSALRARKGMTIILIAHAKVEKFSNPETDTYDRYAPRLHKHAAALIQEWCDEVLFATYKVFTKTSDEGFNKTRAQGIGTGERVIRTVERPAHLAKNRLNLPEVMPLDWRAYAKELAKNNGAPAKA